MGLPADHQKSIRFSLGIDDPIQIIASMAVHSASCAIPDFPRNRAGKQRLAEAPKQRMFGRPSTRRSQPVFPLHDQMAVSSP